MKKRRRAASLIVLIFYRYTFHPLNPQQLAPPYWINMGAMAISTLAGTVLVGNAARSRLLMEILPFVKGVTLLFWATATWWIPLLVLLGIWRHVVRRVSLTYDIVYWSAVFPLESKPVTCARRARMFVSDQRERTKSRRSPHLGCGPAALGMYTACTHRLAQVIEHPWLSIVPRYFVFIAMAAWGVTFFGLLRRQFRWLAKE